MSDFTKSDMPSDTQDTFFEESQADSQFAKDTENTSGCFTESQDFHLLDTGDSQEFETDLSKEPTDKSEVMNVDKVAAKSEETVDNENKEETMESNDRTLERQEEDDEDIVHGTPPHHLSSPKKLSTIADLKSLKRRADSVDDVSVENSNTIKRNKIDSEVPLDDSQGEPGSMKADIQPIENLYQTEDPEESLIIPETQDSMQDTLPIDAEIDLGKTEKIVEPVNNDESGKNLDLENENSLEEECDLVNEAIDSIDDENIKNQNDSTVANFNEEHEKSVDEDFESKNVSAEIDFTDDVSFPEKVDGEGDAKELENATKGETALLNTEKQTEKTDGENKIEAEVDKTEEEANVKKPKLATEEAEKQESIEDALKQLGEETAPSEPAKQTPVEKESTESELLAALTDSDTNAEVDKGSGNKEVSGKIEVSEKKEVAMEAEVIPEAKVEQSDKAVQSRMSIEVIQEIKSKPAEIVEIDDDEVKMVLDSSQEDNVPSGPKDDNIYKSCLDDKSNSDLRYKSVSSKDSIDVRKTEPHLTNGNEPKKMDSDATMSLKSDESLEGPKDQIPREIVNSKSETGVGNPPLLFISDSEGDSMLENKSTSESHPNVSAPKTLQVEKEFSICVKLKCLVTIDETSKEIVSKEVLGVNCALDQLRNIDMSSSLADISGNDGSHKDDSSGSVISTTYPRLSIMSISTVSSTTSSSSSGSRGSKISGQDKMFSVPKGPAKHTKKLPYDEKNILEMGQLSEDWKNPHLVSTSVLNFVNAELSGLDLQNGVADSLDDPLKKIRSSTPEISKETPQRGPKKGRPPKRLQKKRMKINKIKTSPNVVEPIQVDSDNQSSSVMRELKSRPEPSGSVTPVKKSVEGLRSITPLLEQADELLGREVFAKWSDNNYYSGKVVDKTKLKYKVNFNDGKSKMLISEFIVPIPKVLNRGLSVYTLTKEGDYGPCGMIAEILILNNKVSYVIEPDEGKRITVQIKDIFLTGDQAQLLREENDGMISSLASTPQSISKVTLDNMVDGKRRSRRNASSTHTPKSKKSLSSLMIRTSEDEPSVSGVRAPIIEKDGKTSDSNCSVVAETNLVNGVQREINGTANEQVSTKGPQSRLKGKQRSKRKQDDKETIELLGPIPDRGSRIFEGMCFLLTCAEASELDRFNKTNGSGSEKDCSEVSTDIEGDWQKSPFVRDRLEEQLLAGGGKVYDNFDQIPESERNITKLITNVPNLTAKSLLCLSVGIAAYNHSWIINSCKKGQLVNAAQHGLPAGWSIMQEKYFEMFDRRNPKPLNYSIVVFPKRGKIDEEFVDFWCKVCSNAGAAKIIVDNPDVNFIEGTFVLTDKNCPSWVKNKADEWDIPLVTTTWLCQCLIEGQIVAFDANPKFQPFPKFAGVESIIQ